MVLAKLDDGTGFQLQFNLPTKRWPTTFPILYREFSHRRESRCCTESRVKKTRMAHQRRTQVLIVKNDRIRPFRIEVAQEVLSDLRHRLKNTRFSYQAEGRKLGLGHRYRLPQGTGLLLA